MQERVSSGVGRSLPPRKASLLAAMVAAGALFYSALAPALGLGDISLHSSLNQPLNADIDLVDAEGLDRNDLAVGLATADEYARAGIDRVFFLNHLRFSTVFRGGRKFIHVTSVKPVTEPYLSFVVQVSRPGGQLLRDYTILLDPAGTVPLAPATIPTGSATQAEQGTDYTRAAATPTPPPPAPPKAASAKPAAALPAASLNKHYSVEAGDTLWSVSKKLNAAGTPTPPNQLVRELRELNPKKGPLQAGQSLLLPDTAVLPGAAPAAMAPATDSAGKAAVGQGSAGAPGAAGQTPEQLAATVIQNQQLQQSLDDAQARLQAITEQDALKDRQLADLQARLAATGSVAAAPAPAATSTAAGGSTPPGTATPANPASTAAGAPSPGGSAAPNTPLAPAATPAPARPAVTAPVATPAPVADDDSTWLMIAGALAIILLLLAMLLLARRRRVQQQNSFEPVLAIAEVNDDVVVRPARAPVPAASLAETRPAAVRSEPVVPAAPAAAARRETAPATDALDGASIYIAYGRFNEALGILREGLQNEPHRTDLRVRMLEVLGQQGDASGFAEQEEALRAGGYSEPALEQVRARFPKLAPAAAAPVPEPPHSAAATSAATAAAAAGVIAAGVAAAEALKREPTPPAEAQEQLPASAEPAPQPAPVQLPAAEEPLELDIDDFPDLGSFDETPEVELVPEPLPESFDEFQLNLDDLSLDADWEMVSPFETPGRNKPSAPEAPAAPPEVDHEFASNLKELPEVFEMPDEQFLSDFADPQLQVDIEPGLQDEPGTPDPDQEALDNAFLDSFIADADLPELDALTVDFDDLERQQESADKLEQAQSFIARGDFAQASDLLLDLLREGDDACKHTARQLLSSIS